MVKFLMFAVFLLKSHIWEKSKNDKKRRFFEFWYRFMEIKSWLKNVGVGMDSNGCGHSSLRIPKSTESQEVINLINWFLVCWYKFRKAKSYFFGRGGQNWM